MGGAVKITNRTKGERQVKALLRNQTRVKVDAETSISGAGKQMEKMEKRIEKLEKRVKALEAREEEWWAKRR